ncbi:MAG: polysaccharide biosynthesis tyrosine autokinase [Acidobacteria bacterium]|nr:polysaccharide biosynthesis tyrosine autokinase [Acidobacteriota bacterium]
MQFLPPTGSNGAAPNGVRASLLPVQPPQFQAALPPVTPATPIPRLLWEHKFLILFFMILGAIAGTVGVIIKPPMYKAATTVELLGFNQSFMGLSQVDPQAGTDAFSASASNIQTQIRILTSRTILSRTVERLNLEMTPSTSSPPTPFAKIRARIPIARKEPIEQNKEAITTAAMTVSARGVGATRLIQLECDSTSPEVAANFLNTLAAEHISQNLSARSSATQRTAQWMEAQLEESRARLQGANDKLREFVQKSGLDFFPEQATLADTKMRQLQGDVSSIQADRISKQARYEMARNASSDVLPDVVADPNLQGMKAQIITLRREMAPLLATLTPEHYKVKRIQAQITETEQAFEKEKSALLRRLQNDYEEALRKERLLGGAYNAQTRAVGSQADKAGQYATLKREVEMAQQVYNSLLQQSNQAAMVALVPTSNIRVVDQALVPDKPSSPNPVKDIPTAAILGAALGAGLIWARDQWKRKKLSLLFDAPGHSRMVLGVPELGVIPSATLRPPPKLIPRIPLIRRRLEPAATVEEPVLELEAWQQQSPALTESFRHAFTSILRSKPAGHSAVYVITSVGPGEGKTTLSANLAMAMAESGHSVLLVDADLRRARLHRFLGLPETQGLSDLLTDGTPVDGTSFADYYASLPSSDLKVMTHGLADTPSPAVLFFSKRLEKIIASLREQFDFVLIDTAPALPFPDSRLIGKSADGVVLVVRSGVTTRESAQAICGRFQEDGIPVLGTILNDWIPQAGAPTYQDYYATSAPGKDRRNAAPPA